MASGQVGDEGDDLQLRITPETSKESKIMRIQFTYALLLGTVAMSAPALAHPKLLVANPAAQSSVSPTKTISLAFSEKLIPKLTNVAVAMVAMRDGTAHAPSPVIPAEIHFGTDGKSVAARFAKPLAAGSYRVTWRIVGADTHRIDGSYDFVVR